MKRSARLTVSIIGLAALVALAATAPRTAHAVCASGGTVSDVNDCVPVGKGGKDCHAEWSITLADGSPPPDKNGFPDKKVTCVDNDPTCDLDVTPGQCTFSVGLCVNVTDPRIPGCTPGSADIFDFGSPSDKDALKKSHKDPNFRDNRRNLLLEMEALLPTAAGNACTDEVPFVVAMKKKFKDGVVEFKKGKGKIKYKQTDTTININDKDSDTLKFTCAPNEDDDLVPDIDTQPIASARQIVAANELIGGRLAMGQVGDWLLENDKARFIVSDVGRDFSFMLTYGGKLIDADIQRQAPTPGSPFAPPYPPGKDNFIAMAPLINISSTDNPSSIVVVNSGAAGGDAILRTSGVDDLFDPIDPDVAVRGFNAALGITASANDVNIPVTVVNEYTLAPGDNFLKLETIITNTSGSELPMYIGDFTEAGGQLEVVAPGMGFGIGAVRVGADLTLDGGDAPQLTMDYFAWLGFGDSAGLSYALIPSLYNATGSFGQSGVFVPIYAQSLTGILLAGGVNPPVKSAPAGGNLSFTRFFAVSTNGLGQVLDARHELVNRLEIPLDGEGSEGTFDLKKLKTGVVRGTVTVDGTPVDGARVVIAEKPGDRTAEFGIVSEFETTNGGYYQGTFPQGKEFVGMVHVPGHPFQGGGASPQETVFKVGGSTTTVDFDVPAAAWVQVLSEDNFATDIAAKTSVVGFDLTPDPGIAESVPFLDAFGNVFGYLASDRVDEISGLADVRFAGSDGDTGVFALPPGDYQFVVSHGIEYDTHDTGVVSINSGTHTQGSPFVVNAVLTRVVDTPGFVGTDHHVHLMNSPDSTVTRDERIITMLAEGVDYFVATDHDFVTDLTGDLTSVDFPSGGSGDVSALIGTAPGSEITTFDSGHFNAYPLDHSTSDRTGGAVDWGDGTSPAGLGYPSDGEYDLSPDAFAQLAKGPPHNATVVQVNHFNSPTLGWFKLHGIDTTTTPPSSSVDPNEVRQDPAETNLYSDEINALELWIESSLSQNERALGENMGDWFNMLNNFDSSFPLLRKTAVGDSDTHSLTVEQAGGPRTYVASSTDDPNAIDPNEVSANILDGRAILSSGPFVEVTLVNTDTTAQASHDLADPLLVASHDVFGTTDRVEAQIEIHAPTWAPFDTVEVFISNTPSCSTSTPNFLGATKEDCAPDKTLFTSNYRRFNTTPGIGEGTLTVSTIAGVDGGSQLEGTITPFFINAPTYNQDFWVVVVVSGNDNESASMFPMNPNSMPIRACTFDECQLCETSAECVGGANTCDPVNTTVADLANVTATECGVRALAITNPLFVDADADGMYKGVSIP